MKKIFVLILIVMLVVSNLKAQSKKTFFSIGPELSIPTFSEISGSGIGGGISIEHFFSKRIDGNLTISLVHFSNNVFNFNKSDTLKGFSVLPVLPGLKYFITERLYAGGAAGMVIGIHHAASHFALSPEIGLLFPVSAKAKIDIGAKLIGVLKNTSFPENIFLNRGGYSFVTFRAAYIF